MGEDSDTPPLVNPMLRATKSSDNASDLQAQIDQHNIDSHSEPQDTEDIPQTSSKMQWEMMRNPKQPPQPTNL